MREHGLLGGVSAAGLAVALFAAAGELLSACAPARYRLAGTEAVEARELFAAAAPAFPFQSSYSGIAQVSGSAYPFIAGVNSRSSADETVGFYDPMGRAVLIITNDGSRLTVSPGPAAGELPAKVLPAESIVVPAGPLSLGGILSGAAGYPVGEGTPARTADGAWVYADGRQTLFTDPLRRRLARAEYEIANTRVVVTYPDRDAQGPPPVVAVEASGAKFLLRRD